MHRFIYAILIAVFLASPGFAQEKEQQAPKPQTKLEAFQAKTGIVVVRGYSTIGKLDALGGEISVGAREFRDASNPSIRVTGISISVAGNTENTSYIDSDEIDSLLAGIDYISKIKKEITQMENFEAEYKTKGDFSVTVFNDNEGKLSVAVNSGRMAKTFIKMSDLPKLRELIVTAKSKL